MCLLVVLFGEVPGAPLLVGANRDERLERPATAMTVLRPGTPRVLGGRDELAGGTWLAVNEHGVVAGLTNRPSTNGRDPSKRSRGELPLAFVGHADAASAVADVCGRVDPADYNPCWLLVGDRRSLYYVDMTRAGRPEVTRLRPGVHVMENRGLESPSPKRCHVAARLAGRSRRGMALDAVAAVLRDHTVPPGAETAYFPPSDERPATGEDSSERGGADSDGPDKAPPPELSAACVHGDGYGTRSSLLVSVPDGDALPQVSVADGPPCRTPFAPVDELWSR